METPQIVAIAALGLRTHNICHGDKLLWTISEDLQRLKRLTLNHPIIMGRKTYESIGKPLPNRTNIVLTRNKDFNADENVLVVNTKEDALNEARNALGGDSKIVIFGGAEIYNLFLPETTHLQLTLVDSDKEGTAQFPEYEDEFEIESEEEGGTYDDTGVPTPYRWVDYKRKSS